MKIALVTDSTADLTPELIREFDIEVIPLQVSIDNQSFRDGVDLSADEFYQKIQTTNSLPVTSQPSPGVFINCYQKLLQKYDAIISIHLAEFLSGTVRTAQVASEMLPNAKITVIDSQSTSMGLGSIVLEAARAIQREVEFEQVVTLVKNLREKIQFIVALDTLEFLKRGGRATKFQAFLSSILQIKPLLKLVKGEVKLFAKVRTRRESIQLLVDEFTSHIATDSRAIISIMYTVTEKEAFKIKAMIQEMFHNAEVIINQAGPVLGTHVGPGALALICLPKVKFTAT